MARAVAEMGWNVNKDLFLANRKFMLTRFSEDHTVAELWLLWSATFFKWPLFLVHDFQVLMTWLSSCRYVAQCFQIATVNIAAQKCCIITAKTTCSWHQLILCWRSHHFSAPMFLSEHIRFPAKTLFPFPHLLYQQLHLWHPQPIGPCVLTCGGREARLSVHRNTNLSKLSRSPSVLWERGITDRTN